MLFGRDKCVLFENRMDRHMTTENFVDFDEEKRPVP